mgnify:FL=1
MFYEFFLALDTDCFTEIISLEPFYSPWLHTNHVIIVKHMFYIL